MGNGRTLIVCKSVHHQNTAKVARAIADVMQAEICVPEEVPYSKIDEYDLIGLGSGIYFGRFHSTLRHWVRGMPSHPSHRRRAFLFSTSGLSCLWRVWHWPLKAQLLKRGFDVVAEFHCRGFDTFGPLWLMGGINHRRPNEQDLQNAADFARNTLVPLFQESSPVPSSP